jgi:transcriptional regulator with GAF, ATPase, and Fis domain
MARSREPQQQLFESLEAYPALTEAAATLFYVACQSDLPEKLLQQSLPRIAEALGASFAAVVSGEKGVWRPLAATGREKSLPTDLLSTVLDSGAPRAQGEWLATPIRADSPPGLVFVVKGSWETSVSRDSSIETVARWLAEGIAVANGHLQSHAKLARLEAIIGLVGQWRQHHSMEPLLVSIAETSTRLLRAERASIFLWDHTTHTLVGRPALGVEGGELRIPDSTGIVGRVVQSGETRRVDADIESEQREVDRRVDKQLKFETRTILCVPMRTPGGQLLGAFEVLNKLEGNFTSDDEQALLELASHAAAALESTQTIENLSQTRKQIADHAAAGVELIGQCPAVVALRSAIKRVADTDLAVLILGENGTGKEVVSQLIHYLSRRRDEPFIAVNCAAISESLLESELFGHEKGAFTDAREMRVGKFELAAGGTLFLDEIGDMSLGGQAKLLRVLEEKIVVRVGGSVPIPTKARVLAATNQNLGELVRSKRFREDLFFRLNVVSLDLPPLRNRSEDIILLAEHFLKQFAARARRRLPKFTAAARKRLLTHNWPGNIRELRNLMERLAYLSADDQERIDADELEFILAPSAAKAGIIGDGTLADATREFQIAFIQKNIESARGNMTLAAEKIGLQRSNLYRKMRQLEMDTGSDDLSN